MKQKLRKIKTPFFFLFLGFFGCQPEEGIIGQGNHRKQFTVEKITESQFRKRAPKAFGKIKLLEKEFKNTAHQRIVAVNNEFEVDTDEIVQITKGDQVSYTLPVTKI